MQRVSTLPARRRWPLDEEGSRLRVSPAGRVANRSNEKGRPRALRGARAGDRFAVTVISLTLDEVDATQVPDQRRGSERQT